MSRIHMSRHDTSRNRMLTLGAAVVALTMLAPDNCLGRWLKPRLDQPELEYATDAQGPFVQAREHRLAAIITAQSSRVGNDADVRCRPDVLRMKGS